MDEKSQTPRPASVVHFPARTVRRAVIDVGTNSVKLLVADVDGRVVEPIHERSEQTRLGSGFYETHRLKPAAVAHTARAAAEFVVEAKKLEARTIRVFATSAARDAINPDELIGAIRKETGLPLEIISGEQEADWVFRGVVSDPVFAGRPLLIVDVGGGSTEFIVGEGEHQRFRRSFKLGTVRLLEQLSLTDPPTGGEWDVCRRMLDDFIEHQIRPPLDRALPARKAEIVQLVGTGGTTSILARVELGLGSFERDRMEALRLTRDRVRHHRERLWSIPLAERKKIRGLPANRADVILTGVAIYERLMKKFDFADLRVSTRGLRFAAVMEE
jgi:exopolyphosphatase/guanosine-5'-triphosphate,3'-diphosphate pyrophosphatase